MSMCVVLLIKRTILWSWSWQLHISTIIYLTKLCLVHLKKSPPLRPQPLCTQENAHRILSPSKSTYKNQLRPNLMAAEESLKPASNSRTPPAQLLPHATRRPGFDPSFLPQKKRKKNFDPASSPSTSPPTTLLTLASSISRAPQGWAHHGPHPLHLRPTLCMVLLLAAATRPPAHGPARGRRWRRWSGSRGAPQHSTGGRPLPR